MAIINFRILSGQKYTQMTWKDLRETGRRGGYPVDSSFIQFKTFPN